MAQTKVSLIKDNVIVVGHLHTNHGITTGHIGEGSNLYFTDARVMTSLGSVSTHIIPDTNIAYDLGSPTNRFRDLYLSSNTIHLGTDTKITVNNDGEVEFKDSSDAPKRLKVRELDFVDDQGRNKRFKIDATSGRLATFDAVGTLTADKLDLSAMSTTDLSEGSNLYYTDARVGTYLTTNSYATQVYVNQKISDLVASAPSTLDTLNELAAALGDDPNFATTVSGQIGTKWTQDNAKIANWDTAYGWGNHASAGYLTTVGWNEVTGKPSTFTPSAHNHDDRYYTETESDARFQPIGSYLTSYTETSTLDSVADRGRSTNQQLISTNPAGFRVDSGSYARIELDSTDNWSYVRLQDQGVTTWDIACYNSGNLEWRPGGGETNRMTLSQSGYLTINGSMKVVGGVIDMNNNDGFVYDDGSNIMYVKLDGTNREIIHSANIGSQSVNYANSSGSVAWGNVSGKPSTFPASGHDHDRAFITDTRGAQRAPSYYDDRYVQWDFQNYVDTGAGGDGWHVLQTISPWSSYDPAHRQQQLVFTGTGGIKFRYATSDSAWAGWQTIWTSGNDGSGSGLDADTTDGYHFNQDVRTSASPSFNNLYFNGHLYGRSVNAQYSNIYRIGGIYFTWDSDSYGTNNQHSIRSTYGDAYGDNITINSYGNVRINIDSNGNGTNYFTVGRHTTNTENTIMTVDEGGNLTMTGNIYAGQGDSFYQDGNTTYYLYPTATSVLNTVKFGTVGGSWGSAMVSTGSSAGWGTGAYPWIGSNGGSTGSIIMIHNPHIPFRTENARSGASGRAGIRCAIDTNASNWWDIGLYGDAFEIYRNSSGQQMFHVDNARNSYSWGSSRAPIFYDSNNTGYYLHADGTSRINRIDYTELHNTSSSNNGRFLNHSSWGTLHQTDNGYIQFGPANTSHAHIYTDRSNFYFNVDTNADTTYARSSSRAPIFYDSSNTGYYADPASTSVFNDFRCDIMYDKDNTAYYVRPGSTSILNDARANIWYSRSNTAYFSDPEASSILNVVKTTALGVGTAADGAAATGGILKVQGATNGVPGIRVDSAAYSSAVQIYFGYNGSGVGITNNAGYAATGLSLRYGTTTVGSIKINSTSTQYLTSSDYRLKENVTTITDGIERVKLLQPKRFNFIGETDTVDGFIAHEAQEVVPEAVAGEKDAVDHEGNPEYQGIDQAKLVPLLTAALQEAIAKIESLEARIQVLENQ